MITSRKIRASDDMKHYMKLNPDPFQRIANGRNTLELRLNDEKRQQVKIGDEIEFTELSNEARTITVRVIGLHHFPTFKELYESIALSKLGHDSGTITADDYIDMLSYYSEQQQVKHGVLGIEIVLK